MKNFSFNLNLTFSVCRVMLMASLMASASVLSAQTFPQNFSQVAVASGLSNPTVTAFAPDGRIFVAQQNGVLIVIKNGVKLSTPALQITVNSTGERGIMGLALHPSFSTNGFVYLYYTLPDGSRNRVSRFTMSGDVINPSSEVIILNLDPLGTSNFHNAGAMHFKGDKLYIAVGDNFIGANGQNLETYLGKLLRVNADGSAPADNPFNIAGASEQRKRIWAYGLRNPFTFAVQPGIGRIFVNDVGQYTWEEINDATTGGLNFGWSKTEGPTTNIAYTSPIFAYQHGSGDEKGCAITGGVFFNPSSTNYPASLIGKYFYQDLCNEWINYLDLSSGVVRNGFVTGMPAQSVGLNVGTDGNLYYLSRTAGTLYKIIFTTNQSPVITNQPDDVTVTEGQPATFQVTATGTAPLGYQWRKNTVNIPGATSATYTIPAVQPSHAGDYQVAVSNAAGSTVSQVATLSVTAFNAPPVASITLPATGALYRGGDVINFSGTATDPEQGTLPPSAFSWSLVFHHGSHVHDGPPIAQGITSGSFTVPNTGETATDVFYRLHLTVTDAQGLTGTKSVDINPRTSTITLNSDPPGLSVTLDGQPFTTPYSILGVEGMQRTIGVTSPQVLNGSTYTFSNWSQGGDATQTISIPVANTTYTANFSFNQAPAITDQPDNIIATEGQPATFKVTATGTAPLNYQWRKNTVNIPGATSATYTIPAVQPSHAGDYQVVVSNIAGSVVSQIATLAFNTPPVASITLPATGALYRGGDVINFSGTATDPEQGTLPPSAFSWSLMFHHGSHVHDGPSIAQGIGSGSFTIPNTGETATNVFYRLHLTATDAQGLTGTTSVDINPRTSTITLNSNPPGLSATLDEQPITTPYSTLGVEGIKRTIGVASPQVLNGVSYTFSNWSQGGSAMQTITTPQDNTTYTANFSVSSTLPLPWLTTNIGNVGIEGGASFNNDMFTISGSGNGMGANDAFRYVYQPVSGNVEIHARVTGISNINALAKAGVMIRETLNGDSKYASVVLTPGAGAAFQKRTTTGASSVQTAMTGSAPYWVKLVRHGNKFTAYLSSNGNSWARIGSVNIKMSENVFIGLPVTSNNNSALCTATITNVTVTGGSSSLETFTSIAEPFRKLSLFPNPLQDNILKIEYILPSASVVRLQVVNMFGKVIHEKNLGRQEGGTIRYEMDLFDLSAGTYILRMLYTNGNQSAVFIKQ